MLPVTLLAGVWIETSKSNLMCLMLYVTLLAGVWIETILITELQKLKLRHAPCGRVD